ncbi:MAG: hypothetical protein HY231_23630 [Acidobacteria bacterium]|nr:hypothetical protein [Acidobacteriota bacterium]
MITVILRPPSPVTETVACITIAGATLRLRLPEYVEEFRLLARRLGYEWQRPYWTRQINGFNGSLEDRLIEAGYKILAAGFIVELPDERLKDRVVAGDYEDERTRWIYARTSGKYVGWFAINWGRDEDYYNEARRLRGSRYSKPSVVVPADQFEEVLDFAEVLGFRLSPGAGRLVEQAQAKRAQEIRVELRPRAQKMAQTIMETITGEIAEELRDDG